MKIKTLAWIQIILGVYFLVFEGLWINFTAGLWLSQLGQNVVAIGFGLFAFLTGLYNLNQKK